MCTDRFSDLVHHRLLRRPILRLRVRAGNIGRDRVEQRRCAARSHDGGGVRIGDKFPPKSSSLYLRRFTTALLCLRSMHASGDMLPFASGNTREHANTMQLDVCASTTSGKGRDIAWGRGRITIGGAMCWTIDLSEPHAWEMAKSARRSWIRRTGWTQHRVLGAHGVRRVLVRGLFALGGSQPLPFLHIRKAVRRKLPPAAVPVSTVTTLTDMERRTI
ncbi:hypothetical protein BC628DRAFT_1116776 [Trametes gibbosa]|nr:hypothetical protein BC628DRAFT_1116776 [Trametes gibbosa]